MTPAQSSTQKLIAALWHRSQPTVLQRLDLLDRAAAAASSNLLTLELREQAADIAHKLAGSLGMFGFHEGTGYAGQIEHMLESPAVNPDALSGLTTQLRQSIFPAAQS
jgi:HPt (histidine-containing phosphotransfer) domain-containing protein